VVLRRAAGSWRPLVALVLALSASGAGGVALDAVKHPAQHRCRCHHGPDEDCACPGCHRALVAQAEDSGAPPCHRAAAKARLARAARHPDAACVKGSCGSEDEQTPRAPQHDPVVLSRAPALRSVPAPRLTALDARVSCRGAGRPATPPPRAS